LKLLNVLPDDAERMRDELAMRSIESVLAFVLHGASSNRREEAIRRMCELGERLGQREELISGLINLSNLHYTRGEALHGIEVARRTLDLVEGTTDADLIVDAQFSFGCLAFSCGRFSECAAHLQDAIANSAQTKRIINSWGFLYSSGIKCHLAPAVHLLGRVAEAAKLAAEELRQVHESNHLFSLGHALVCGGWWLDDLRRETDAALAHGTELIALAEDNGFAEWQPWGHFIYGRALCELGRVAEGLAEMEVGIAGCRRLARARKPAVT
jgi:hypothetical protein